MMIKLHQVMESGETKPICIKAESIVAIHTNTEIDNIPRFVDEYENLTTVETTVDSYVVHETIEEILDLIS